MLCAAWCWHDVMGRCTVSSRARCPFGMIVPLRHDVIAPLRHGVPLRHDVPLRHAVDMKACARLHAPVLNVPTARNAKLSAGESACVCHRLSRQMSAQPRARKPTHLSHATRASLTCHPRTLLHSHSYAHTNKRVFGCVRGELARLPSPGSDEARGEPRPSADVEGRALC
jgi:hypothetical protein